MLTLAVDTTAEFGSIALIDAEGIREEVLLHAPAGFSGPLFEQIAALLRRQDVELADIDLFAGASGPGSFTGVRIGLAAVKGLGEVLGKPVIAVSNLEALAEFGEGDLRATVIDARRGEVFAAVFDRHGAAVIPECVVSFPRLLEMLGERECEFISSNFDPFRAALVGTRFEQYPVIAAPRALAGTIGRIAMRRLAGGATGDPAAIEGNYVRRSDAELLWKEQA
ncbi:MAG: tRNA (adenosine(37)-N6)-threonylcarbamoyltransferase complex dimerization subunit type 1 TsaB [Bryobacteraceae bacterium]|jgi:tRNA threonylcarbamoyladenosine biosynthesis protein TsaB